MYHHRLRLIAFMAIVCSLSACKKTDFQDPAQRCKILETSDRFFTYDARDNPTLFAYKDDPDATGRPTFGFIYDSRHHLKLYGGYSTHRLTLNANGHAVIDSLESNYAGQDDRYAIQIFYDQYGRVNKEITTYYHAAGEDLPTPHEQSTGYYHYDKRGNLLQLDTDGIGYLEYDNKPSILRTNPVLMFVHRNYSVNNPKGEAHHNSAGLPDTWYGNFLDGSGIETGIVYACDKKNSK